MVGGLLPAYLPSRRILHSFRSRLESSSSLASISRLLFFCSISSAFSELIHAPILAKSDPPPLCSRAGRLLSASAEMVPICWAHGCLAFPQSPAEHADAASNGCPNRVDVTVRPARRARPVLAMPIKDARRSDIYRDRSIDGHAEPANRLDERGRVWPRFGRWVGPTEGASLVWQQQWDQVAMQRRVSGRSNDAERPSRGSGYGHGEMATR